MLGYKGFNPYFICLGKKYSEHSTFREPVNPVVCLQGMHFCKSPVDVLNYYGLINKHYALTEPFIEPNIFCNVEALGKIAEETGGIKCATDVLSVQSRIPLKEYIGLLAKDILTNQKEGCFANTEGCAYLKQITSWLTVNTGDYSSMYVNDEDACHIANTGNGVDINITSYSVDVANCGDCCEINSLVASTIVYNEGRFCTIKSNSYDDHITSIGYGTKIYSTGGKATIKNTGNNCYIVSAGGNSRIKNEGTNVNVISTGPHTAVSGVVGSVFTLTDYLPQKDGFIEMVSKTIVIDDIEYKANTWYDMKEGEVRERV